VAQRVLLLRLTPLGLGVRLISPNLFQPRVDLESALAPRARRELSSEKAQLRRSFLARREGLPLALVERHSARIIRRFWRLQAAREKGWLSSYVAFAGEIRTRPLIEEALCRGWRVAVPVVSPEPGGALLLSEVKDLEAELRKGRLGIWEPRASAIRPVMPQVIDCFVIPGIAFDRGGRRLGFGQGYYDRLLAGARPDAWRIGLAFSC
jgi:5-formyltetrahydrofolate cyclo-ligase